MRNYETTSPEVLFQICELFLEQGSSANDAARKITSSSGAKFSREDMYPLLREAFRRKYLRFAPPLSQTAPKKIGEAFALDPSSIQVVNVRGESARGLVGSATADLLVDLIYDVAKSKGRRPVRIGLAGGSSVKLLAP